MNLDLDADRAYRGNSEVASESFSVGTQIVIYLISLLASSLAFLGYEIVVKELGAVPS